MSESNVELVRRGIEAFNRGDPVTRLLTPDVHVHGAPELPNSGDFHGHDGFFEWARGRARSMGHLPRRDA